MVLKVHTMVRLTVEVSMTDIPSPRAIPRPSTLTQAVSFTEGQLAWLDKQFPEPKYMIGTDEKAFMVRSIQRGVVHEIRARLAKANGGA